MQQQPASNPAGDVQPRNQRSFGDRARQTGDIGLGALLVACVASFGLNLWDSSNKPTLYSTMESVQTRLAASESSDLQLRETAEALRQRIETDVKERERLEQGIETEATERKTLEARIKQLMESPPKLPQTANPLKGATSQSQDAHPAPSIAAQTNRHVPSSESERRSQSQPAAPSSAGANDGPMTPSGNEQPH